MSRTFNFKSIEQKWRPYWREIDLYRTGDEPDRPKHYILDYFPYPSGDGLSVGHCRNYVPTCIYARFRRMQGDNVLHPMGWDAFGLPAENYAIQHGVHPRRTTSRQADTYRRQLQLIECSYDWSREINSSDPEYYRWTQWFFLLLFRRGLAYRAPGEQWWCPVDQTILANEQVEDGRCWRCGSEVTTKVLQQWYFRITEYAERLLADLEHVDWPESIKAMQRHWIGRSEAPDGTVSYRMHDWLISRQRFWGAPIPIVHCPECGPVPVPEDQLPVRLPDLDDFAPAGDGRAPLARVESWVNTPCPQCGGPAQRETDTMDGFACSSWYFLRFASPHESDRPFDPEAARYWLPVDTYVGGAEHAVMHLLYARFWTKVMYDAGLIDFQEPFAQLRNQGVLHAPDGRRMSKSRGNVITPDEVVAIHGVDALRTYIVFMGPFDANVIWDEGQGGQGGGIRGVTRFLNRFWDLAHDSPAAAPEPSPAFARQMHHTIRRVSEDMEAFKFNTAVAALMEWANYLQQARDDGVAPDQWREALDVFCRLLAPIAPFISEEVWQETLGREESVHRQPWPEYDPALLQAAEITIAVQVNGRLRDTLTVAADIDDAALRQAALASPNVQRHVDGKEIRKTIIVPRQVINIVT
ncbi:MAG TPA: class I tRNA ligase family protein [Candidatus Sulfomarinibacteraceae bacterium]|nr:class I tRNA ligase family protein [Candidatus Sulfomarinibacteraceae bacterium]